MRTPILALAGFVVLAAVGPAVQAQSAEPQQAATLEDCIGPITLAQSQAQQAALDDCLALILDNPLVQEILDCVNRLFSPQAASTSTQAVLLLCQGDDVKLCTYPEVGVEPTCITVDVELCDVDSGTVGVVVNGRPTCVPIPDVKLCTFPEVGVVVNGFAICLPIPTFVLCEPPEYGVVVGSTAYCVNINPQQCPSGTVGIRVNNVGTCVPLPGPCDGEEIGYGPACLTADVCGGNQIGVVVNGVRACVNNPCPNPVDTNPLSACGVGVPEVPDDQDNDGYTDSQEASGGSNVRSAASTPPSDDDGDGTPNLAEPNSGANQARDGCTGSYGVVKDRTCGGYVTPGTTTTAYAFTANNLVWAWDALCTPAASGSYAACKSTSNYAASPATYNGAYTGDGYGWRHVANVPTVGPQNVPIVLPCDDFEADADGDGIPLWRFCNAVLTVQPNGETSTAETSFLLSLGDPDDNEASWPTPQVTEGPYNTVQRVGGDGVYYKLGAKFVLDAMTFNLVQENTIDAGILPKTLSVPSGAAPTLGPDADGDGLPAYVDVPMKAVTIKDDPNLSRTEASAQAFRAPIDPNDGNPLVPEGPGPVTQTVPTWVGMGPSQDGDAFPSAVIVEYSDVTLGGQEVVKVERRSDRDQSLAVDTDDGDADEPVPTGNEVPLEVPGFELPVQVPGVTLPKIGGGSIDTPAVILPATCTLFVCVEPTVLVPGQSIPVPDVPGTNVPSSQDVCNADDTLCDGQERICAPGGLICVGPFERTPLTPPVPGEDVDTPPVGAPAICTATPQVCLPPTQVLGPQRITVPSVGPTPVTPATTVSLSWTGFTGVVDTNAGETTPVGPITVNVGPIPVTVCAQTCPLPIAPEANGQGSATVTVTVGSETYTRTIPVNV